MTPRRHAREFALQILYGLDDQPTPESPQVETALRSFFHNLGQHNDDEADRADTDAAAPVATPDYDHALCESLVRDVMAHRDELDETITTASRNWRIERMARVDRNILRLAVHELRFRPEIPARVTMNEAIELAKRFGAADSAAFVNGLLDSTVKSLNIEK